MGLWTIEKTFTFEAAHALPDHDGPCARMHGHSYRVVVRVAGRTLAKDGPRRGFVEGLDYYDITKAWAPLHEMLDHHTLNAIDGIGYPTVENLSRFIFNTLDEVVGEHLDSVTVHETPTASCTYRAR